MAEDAAKNPGHDHERRRWLSDPRMSSMRLAISIGAGVLTALLTHDLAWRARAVFAWDAAALVYVVLAWLLITRTTPADTRRRAAVEDPGRLLVFVIALVASTFSLFVAIATLRHLDILKATYLGLGTILALGAVALSWLVTHTTFALRYAHLYYESEDEERCLDFPGRAAPADIDFAYFAFGVGMAFQVSDVVTTGSAVRRIVLLHSLISFVYNTTILALALNLVSAVLE